MVIQKNSFSRFHCNNKSVEIKWNLFFYNLFINPWKIENIYLNGKYIKQMRLVISHQKMILRLRNSIY